MSKHECTIIIDTNQFYSDLMLSGLRWKQLDSYIKKSSGATIQMPEIVWRELERNYAKAICNHLNIVESSLEKLNHHLNFIAPKLDYFRSSFELTGESKYCIGLRNGSTTGLVNAYLSFIKEKLGLKAKDFIEIDKAWFEGIIERSVQHLKPFSDESDKGFKDTLLWKSILSLKKKPGFTDHPIILISANNRDFGSPNEKGKLHESLVQEALSSGLDLHYFENLDSFLQKWAGEVIATDFAKIKKIIPEVMIKKALQKYLIQWMRRSEKVEENVFFTGINFRVESAQSSQQIISVSVSGYVTMNRPAFSRHFLSSQYVQGEMCNVQEAIH